MMTRAEMKQERERLAGHLKSLQQRVEEARQLPAAILRLEGQIGMLDQVLTTRAGATSAWIGKRAADSIVAALRHAEKTLTLQQKDQR